MFDLRFNPIAKNFISSERVRIDTPCMNRVINRAHEPVQESILNRVLAGKVSGGKITLTGFVPKEFVDNAAVPSVDEDSNSSSNEATSSASSSSPSKADKNVELWKLVDYDVLKWERSKYGNKPRAIKFSYDITSSVNSPLSSNSKAGLSPSKCDSRTSLLDSENSSIMSLTPPRVRGNCKFSTEKRK